MPGRLPPVNAQAKRGMLRAAHQFEKCDHRFRPRRRACRHGAGPHQRLERRAHSPRPYRDSAGDHSLGGRVRREVMIEEALSRAGAAEDIDEMLAEFLVHYEANIAAESRPFLGAVASLETLAASGARLAICTNKCEYRTRKLLEALGLQHYFKRHRRPRHLRRIEARPGAPHPGDRAATRPKPSWWATATSTSPRQKVPGCPRSR
jgi:phosphoglycolate phosphatase-like HAD superfamily hydrolase